MGCDEVLRLLREREAACRGEAERLRTEMERITALLAMCEEELSRIETACRVVGELPVVHAVSAVVATRVPAARAVPVPEPESGGSGRADARVAAAEFGEEVLAVLGRYAG
ncbi:MAG: hypothetical protein JO362_07765, partial [Streptomycetaceae bacterium]|nr:hypothetical protein [Streptomycetaceae bacterium]